MALLDLMRRATGARGRDYLAPRGPAQLTGDMFQFTLANIRPYALLCYYGVWGQQNSR